MGRKQKTEREKKLSGYADRRTPKKKRAAANSKKTPTATGEKSKSKKPDIDYYLKMPLAPQRLTKAEQKVWREIGPGFVKDGKLRKSNLYILEALCVATARFRELQKLIEEHGYIVRAPSGYPQQNPYVGLQNTAAKEMREWRKQLDGNAGGGSAKSPPGSAGSAGSDSADELDSLLGSRPKPGQKPNLKAV